MNVIKANQAREIALRNDIKDRIQLLGKCMVDKSMKLIVTESGSGKFKLSTDYENVFCFEEFKNLFSKELSDGVVNQSRHDIMDYCERVGVFSSFEKQLKELGYKVEMDKRTSVLDIPLTSLRYEANYRILKINWE